MSLSAECCWPLVLVSLAVRLERNIFTTADSVCRVPRGAPEGLPGDLRGCTVKLVFATNHVAERLTPHNLAKALLPGLLSTLPCATWHGLP